MQIRIIEDYNEELRFLEQLLIKDGRGDDVMQILEAGCGREWYFKLGNLKYECTGLDIDEAALRARQTIKRDITYSVVGDLRTAQLPAEHFDVIYNAFVLEHITGAKIALTNFVRWLKPGGLLIIRVPDRSSVQGFIARCTPHWFHVLYYRWAWKLKDAGKPGFAPYPTVYDDIVSASGLQQFCAENNLDVLHLIGVGSFKRGYGFASKITPLIAKAISIVTLGSIHSRYVDLTIVARKQAQAA